MQPIQIVMRDISNSPSLENLIHEKAEHLWHFCETIHRCKIAVENPQRHKRQGKLYSVRIDLTVPGKEIVVNKNMNEDVRIAIRDAFKAAVRQLENYVDKRRGEVKKHYYKITPAFQ